MTGSRRALVTGGAGFIGSHVCEGLLSEGWRVVSVDNFDDFYSPSIKRKNIAKIQIHPRSKNFTSVRADIRDAKRIAGVFRAVKPTLVVHLAAMAGVRPSIERPLLYEEVNVGGTGVLLDACQKHAVRHLIFASSSSVYGNSQKIPFSESDNVDNPISPYAATKKAGELLCHAYAHLYGMKICVLRFFTVYGPRQRPDLAIHKFTRLIDEGRQVPFYGDGSTKRDYTHIDDIVEGVMKAARWVTRSDKSVLYDIFNLGESRTVSLKEMVHCIERTLGKKAKIQKMPIRPGDVRRTFADIAKSKRVLGYSPSTDFEDGVVKFVDWYRRSVK